MAKISRIFHLDLEEEVEERSESELELLFLPRTFFFLEATRCRKEKIVALSTITCNFYTFPKA
jgi:hypothetical protein